MSDYENGSLGPEGSYYEAKAKQDEHMARKRMDGMYPLLITTLYLILGFVFGLWHPGWLVFFAIPLYYMRPKTPLQKLGNPVMITLIYMVLGFFFNLWHPGWMIFLAIPLAAIADSTSTQK